MWHMRDLITATSGSSFLVLEAYETIAGGTGAAIEFLKLIMVLVIVFTSVIGTLAADRNGDGVPDIYDQIERLFCARKRNRRRAKRTKAHKTEKKNE